MKRSAGSYARAIERSWCEAVRRPVVLSPREWALVSDWHARAIPLQLVLEVIEGVSERVRRGRRAPRQLSYIAAQVEEAWSVVMEGRATGAQESPVGDLDASRVVVAWRDCAASEGEGTRLGVLLKRLLARLDGGASGSEIDRLLDESLVEAAPEELVTAGQQQVEDRLAGFRAVMASRVFRQTKERGIVAWLRRELGLPHLPSETGRDLE